MNKNDNKKRYESPAVEFIELDYKAVVLASIGGQGGTGTDDDFDDYKQA